MNKNKKDFIAFKEINEEFKKLPPVKYLYSGVKEKTFGLVFGPSKSGKSINCENLALELATGGTEYLGDVLDGIPKKTIFIGLEEYWGSRLGRNNKQFSELSQARKKLYEENYLYQSTDYLTFIQKKKDWERLKETIKDSKAEVVFIDSITRMNHGNLEDSRVAQEIMQKLRDICYDLQVTMFCIHHTPKMYGKMLTIDSIKGSSVFAQEADFAIGVNSIFDGKIRYIKNIFFRYAPEGSDKVKVFIINKNTCVKFERLADEYDLIKGEDNRREDDKKNKIQKIFEQNACKEYKTSELIKKIEKELSIKERQIKNYLRKLVQDGKIKNPKNGIYVSVKCKDIREEAIDV